MGAAKAAMRCAPASVWTTLAWRLADIMAMWAEERCGGGCWDSGAGEGDLDDLPMPSRDLSSLLMNQSC